MVEKRSHGNDELQNGAKRTRSNNGSPAPVSSGAAPRPDIQAQIAAARARAAELAAKMGSHTTTGAAPTVPTPSAAETARAKIEAMKARVAAATAKSSGVSGAPRTASPVPVFPPADFDDGFSRARGGLGIGLHPALMGDAGQDARSKNKQAMQPKFATTMANQRTESPLPRTKDKKQLDVSGPNVEELKKNPYFDASLGPQTATGRTRTPRQLNFHQKGKFIAQANALRRQAQLEQMKRRIAESARKAGLDDEGEKAFLVQAPPDIEWWDEGLIDGKDYSDLSRPGKIKLDGADSIITPYIQHPVLLEPPQEKNMPPPKPMYLTSREQAKLRRQRRNADHKEQQAKIRLGLEPPPPPKVKRSNLMRVLGQEAVKDPTAVEARVNREIAERAAAHVLANEARKLSKEQKAEKVAQQQAADAAKGVYCAVYRVDSLSNGQHRYKIDVNAKQLGLTGIVVLHPKMNLVVVEGGEHGIGKYQKLMLNRIDWTENAAPSSVREGNREAEAAFLRAEDEAGQLKDLSANRCVLVWEGMKPAKAFRKWGSRVCETDGEAREVLQRTKMDSFWTLAKSMQVGSA